MQNFLGCFLYSKKKKTQHFHHDSSGRLSFILIYKHLCFNPVVSCDQHSHFSVSATHWDFSLLGYFIKRVCTACSALLEYHLMSEINNDDQVGSGLCGIPMLSFGS